MAGDIVDTVYGPMSGEFAKSPLGDLCVPDGGVQTGPFGSQLHASDYVEYGTPIITVEHLGENRIIHNNVPRITHEDKKRLARYTLITGDIVFSRVGSVDRRAIVHPEENGWLFSGRCLRVRPHRKKIDPGFLSWFFGLPTFREHIRQIAVGATMPSLNTKILGDVPIYYPPSLKEQQTIACILGALDDKIELNRRMNQTLEAMARAIFKSWFVDFDPVRAKAEGRDPGLPDHIAALFPDEFEESELGEIPRGWMVGPIGQLVEAVGGTTPSTTDPAYWDDGLVNWATPKDLAGLASPVLLETARHITEEGLSQISSGLLPEGTVLLSSRAPVGYLAIAEIPVAINQGFIAMKCNGPLSNYYVLWWTEFNMDLIRRHAGGTTFQEISKRSFRPLPALVPGHEVIQAFDATVEPLYRTIVNNEQQSRTLANIRDGLLPKLISGELRVPDAELIIGRCV